MSLDLTYLDGPLEGQKIPIEPDHPELILGRSPGCQIVIDSKNISRKHCKLKQDIDGIWIEDLASKNGVFINGKQIIASTLLSDSDEIQIGDIRLRFSDSNAAILKRLNSVPAFGEAQAQAEPAETLKEEQAVETPEPAELPPPPSPVLDYIFIGLMGIIIIGLIIGALLWSNT